MCSSDLTDEYGGSAEGRRRIHVQVVAEVRRRIGPDRAVFVRLGACDEMTGGIADSALADRIVRRGQADLVGIGRAMLNDAEWARKAIGLLT